MTNYYSSINLDLSVSCTKNVAIGKILDIHSNDPVLLNANPNGDPTAEYREYLEGLELSVFEIISNEREAAQSEREAAIEEGDKVKAKECASRVLHWDNKMRLAHQYLCEIDDELAKGESSKLRIDKIATKSPENQYITLVSLSDWAESIRVEIAERVNRSGSFINSLSSATAESNEKELSSVAANNLYITFALLVEDYVKSFPALGFGDGDPNYAIISQYISNLAKEKTKNAYEPSGVVVKGLTSGKIADNISEAFKRLKKKFE